MLSCTLRKWKWVVHTKICTNENYPLYGMHYCTCIAYMCIMLGDLIVCTVHSVHSSLRVMCGQGGGECSSQAWVCWPCGGESNLTARGECLIQLCFLNSCVTYGVYECSWWNLILPIWWCTCTYSGIYCHVWITTERPKAKVRIGATCTYRDGHLAIPYNDQLSAP